MKHLPLFFLFCISYSAFGDHWPHTAAEIIAFYDRYAVVTRVSDLPKIQKEKPKPFNPEATSNLKNHIRSAQTGELSAPIDPFAEAKTFIFDHADYPEYQIYKESPCYDELGWSPLTAKEVWDKKYAKCESEKRGLMFRNVMFLIFIVGGIGALVYYAYIKPKKEAEENTPTSS